MRCFIMLCIGITFDHFSIVISNFFVAFVFITAALVAAWQDADELGLSLWK